MKRNSKGESFMDSFCQSLVSISPTSCKYKVCTQKLNLSMKYLPKDLIIIIF